MKVFEKHCFISIKDEEKACERFEQLLFASFTGICFICEQDIKAAGDGKV